MKAIAVAAFGIISSVGVCIAASSLASFVMADPQPQKFASLSNPDLWTTSPVRVDVSRQHYERLPPAYSSYVTQASTVPAQRRSDGALRMKGEPVRPGLPTAHLNWCTDRYRSFDPATNTYRSYSGETRTCSSPFATWQMAERGVTEVDAAVHETSPPKQTDATWCAARYASYREEDNSYQPYDGPRRKCIPPFHADLASARNSTDQF